MSNTFKKTSLRGFTLIELLVVIAIIGLLSTAIMGPVQTGLKKGRDTRKISDLTQVQGALLQYAGDNNGKYPAFLTALSPTYMATDTKMMNNAQAVAAGLLKGPAARDKFMYVTYTDTANIIVAYHLGVALENQNASLQGDADCGNHADATGNIFEDYDIESAGVRTGGVDEQASCSQGLGNSADPSQGKLNNANFDLNGAGRPFPTTVAVDLYNELQDFGGAGTAEDANEICSSELTTCIFDIIPK